MTALIVGGDRLGNIPTVLNEKGIYDFVHWKGRKKGFRKKDFPENVDMVIVLYDFIEHNLVNIIKREARNKDVPCIFSKRACSDLAMKLDCAGCKCKENCKKRYT